MIPSLLHFLQLFCFMQSTKIFGHHVYMYLEAHMPSLSAESWQLMLCIVVQAQPIVMLENNIQTPFPIYTRDEIANISNTQLCSDFSNVLTVSFAHTQNRFSSNHWGGPLKRSSSPPSTHTKNDLKPSPFFTDLWAPCIFGCPYAHMPLISPVSLWL